MAAALAAGISAARISVARISVGTLAVSVIPASAARDLPSGTDFLIGDLPSGTDSSSAIGSLDRGLPSWASRTMTASRAYGRHGDGAGGTSATERPGAKG